MKTFISKSSASDEKKRKKIPEEERKAQVEQKVAAKAAKSQFKPKRIGSEESSVPSKRPSSNASGPKAKRAKKNSGAFDEDLSLKKRSGAPSNSSSKHGFKSKKRYKRR